MSLPSSGQISLNSFRAEFSQSGMAPYSFDYLTTGLSSFDNPGQFYAPVNVNSANEGKFYSSSVALNNDYFSNWYGYNHAAYYDTGSTPRLLYLNVLPISHCYNSSMIIFEAGTSNTTLNIRLSGSAYEFQYGLIDSVWVYYGKPWSNSGNDFYSSPGPTNPWGTTVIYSASYYGTPGGDWFNNGFDVSFDYNYVYNSTSGSKVYVVVYSYCP